MLSKSKEELLMQFLKFYKYCYTISIPSKYKVKPIYFCINLLQYLLHDGYRYENEVIGSSDM